MNNNLKYDDFLKKCICEKGTEYTHTKIGSKELSIYGTNLNLDNLPNSIKKIYIQYYQKELNNLPNSIEYFLLNDYKLKIKKIPKNLKTVKCDKYYEYIDDYEVIYY